MSITILYISYDGIFDPVGQAQVLPYLRGLAEKNIRIHLISYEKGIRTPKVSIEGVSWHPLIYHQRPTIPATLFDISRGVLKGWCLARKNNIRIIHARGYISALIAYLIKKISGTRFIFDMRGFWPEEKVDAAAWKKEGFLYRLFKRIEKLTLLNADKVIVLTEAAKNVIKERYNLSNLSVIPCCVDLNLFCPQPNISLNPPLPENKPLIAYVGSVGTFYNFEEAVGFFNRIKQKISAAHFLVLSNSDRRVILRGLSKFKLTPAEYTILSLRRQEVPGFLSQCAFSLVFYRRRLSAAGCSPIKFAESLACGVPVIINEGVGDSDRILNGEDAGIILKRNSADDYLSVFASIKQWMGTRDQTSKYCRQLAKIYFSLEEGIKKYQIIYETLSKG